MNYSTTQKAIAEFVGTLALIFIGAGSICANQFLGGGVGLVGIALAHGLTIAVMVSAIGHISGGHINPAVTIGVWAAGKIPTREALVYWAAQLAGGLAGAALLVLAFDPATRAAVNLGTPSLASGVTLLQGIVVEVLLTFFLVFTVFATAIDDRGRVQDGRRLCHRYGGHIRHPGRRRINRCFHEPGAVVRAGCGGKLLDRAPGLLGGPVGGRTPRRPVLQWRFPAPAELLTSPGRGSVARCWFYR